MSRPPGKQARGLIGASSSSLHPLFRGLDCVMYSWHAPPKPAVSCRKTNIRAWGGGTRGSGEVEETERVVRMVMRCWRCCG